MGLAVQDALETAFEHVIPPGWLQLIVSLKLQVSFTKEPYKIDDILQKRPIIISQSHVGLAVQRLYAQMRMGWL